MQPVVSNHNKRCNPHGYNVLQYYNGAECRALFAPVSGPVVALTTRITPPVNGASFDVSTLFMGVNGTKCRTDFVHGKAVNDKNQVNNKTLVVTPCSARKY
jgi:hypothetical protein